MENNSIFIQLEEDIKTSMKSGDKIKTSTLRMAKSEFKLFEINQKKILSDTEALNILQRMIKQRKESMSQFDDAGRKELAQRESSEIKILQKYLPKQLDEQEVKQIIANEIAISQVKSKKDMGKVMLVLKDKLQGKADMAIVSLIVKNSLN